MEIVIHITIRNEFEKKKRIINIPRCCSSTFQMFVELINDFNYETRYKFLICWLLCILIFLFFVVVVERFDVNK